MRSDAVCLSTLACLLACVNQKVGGPFVAIWCASLSVALVVDLVLRKMGCNASSVAKDAVIEEAPPGGGGAATVAAAPAPPGGAAAIAAAPAPPAAAPAVVDDDDVELRGLEPRSPTLAAPPSPPVLSPVAGGGSSRPSREGSPFEGDKDAPRTELQAPALCFGEGSPARAPRGMDDGDDAADDDDASGLASQADPSRQSKTRKSSISRPDREEAAKNVHALLAALGGLPDAPAAAAPAPPQRPPDVSRPARAPSGDDVVDAPALLGRLDDGGGGLGDDSDDEVYLTPMPDSATVGLVSDALHGDDRTDSAAAARALATHGSGIADGLRLLSGC